MANIFKNPFSPKKAPPRKAIPISPLHLDAAERAREFGLDYHSAYTRLEDHIYLFFDPKNGDWQNEQSGDKLLRKKKKSTQKSDEQKSLVSLKEMQKLQKSNQQLQEENTLLKTKNEILVEMISEVFTEYKLENDLKVKRK